MPHSPLITPTRFASHDGPVVVLDVRWQLGRPAGREDYLRGHIPGAVYVDLDTELAGAPGKRGRHPLPEVAVFEAAMRRCGVTRGTPVVVYDAVAGMAAARCWWLLRYHGHQAVMVLDGGLEAWLADGGAQEEGEVTVPPGDFAAQPGGMPVVDATEADRVAREGVLLDARSPERFRGENEPVDPVAGHIPGAVNVPAQENLEPGGGRFRGAASLTAVYELAGVRPGRDVAVYCGSGVTAAHGVLALDALGLTAALYPGSWSEWVEDRRRPVATGP